MLKVFDSNHVVLKLGSGRHYKGNVTEGLAITDETVTFDDVTVEGVAIDGTLTCTSWDD